MAINRYICIGNVTRDVEVKYTPKGTAVAEIGLAVNEVYKTDSGEKRESTVFLDVEAWGRTAEIAGEYLKKGRSVCIEGKLRQDQWEDKATGQKRTKLKVVCENLQLIGSQPQGEGRPERTSERPAARPESQPPARKQPPKPPRDPDLDADAESDIPF